jgi:predicted nucleic acid-binding protein
VKYLVDTNVLSEISKPSPDQKVLQWLRAHQGKIVINSIILGEIEYGILILPASRRRSRLEAWFQGATQHLPVFDFDAPSASAWASLMAKLKRNGQSMQIKDSLIAATALTHHLKIATRNTIDFRYTGVATENPFS